MQYEQVRSAITIRLFGTINFSYMDLSKESGFVIFIYSADTPRCIGIEILNCNYKFIINIYRTFYQIL